MNVFVVSLLWWFAMFIGVYSISMIPNVATRRESSFTFTWIGQVLYAAMNVTFTGLAALFTETAVGTISAVLFILVGSIILDSAITVPLFVKSFRRHFLNSSHWIGYLVSFVSFIVVRFLVSGQISL